MWEQVATGSFLDAGELGNLEVSNIAEEQRGLLQIDLRSTVSQSIVDNLQRQLVQRGVTEAQVSTSGQMLNISWRKGFPWLAIIVVAVLVLAILIIAWRLYREVVQALGPTGGSLFILAVLGLAVAGSFALRRART